ncbi:MAG TPA: glycoside hydrolase family 97 N-terminal domain-containing protein [Bryobacteraceae bacterium]|nr:glycoside hydrolase family 97 N-terminal domain-containing protein [Bryobacteraceae bacterium]
MSVRLSALVLAALVPAFGQSAGQDERRVVSRDGRVEFRLYNAPPNESGYLFRLAYEVRVGGKLVIDRSYLGIDLLNIEPLLGEKDGLIGTRTADGPGYHSLVAEYMQDGSLGDRIDIEVRVYDDGVAFRYMLPRSTPLVDLNISNEATEFRFAAGKEALGALGEQSAQSPPFIAELPGGQTVAVLEVRAPDFPAMSLARLDAGALVTRLARKKNDSEVAYSGHTPFVGPWRVILFGKDRARLLDAAWLKDLRP